jgi:hypothetical protein
MSCGMSPACFRTAATFAAILCATPAHAADLSPEVEALIKRGNDMRRSHDDQGAFPLFQRAYQMQPDPRTAVQLGLVEQALGRWADADEHLTAGLKGSKEPWIQRNRATIDDSIRKVKPHVARVEVTGDPPGAEVLVNGRPVGKVPLPEPVRVAEGSVDIELRAPGYRRGFRTVTVHGGQYQPVVVRLDRDASAETVHPAAQVLPAPVASRSSASLGGTALATPLSVTPDAPEPAPIRWRPWAIGASLGAAALGAGVGVYGLLRHDSKVTAFNDRMCLETANGVVRRPMTPDETCVSLNTDYRNARIMSIAGFAAAGILGATALVLYLTAPDAAEGASAEARLVCVPDVVSPGVGCRVTF